MNALQRELRKRILRERLAAAEKKRDQLEARLRSLREREGRRMTREVLRELDAHARSTRTAR